MIECFGQGRGIEKAKGICSDWPSDKGGGESSRPWDTGGARSQKNFFRSFGPQFGLKNKRRGGPGSPPWIRHCRRLALSLLSVVLYLKARENREEGKRPLPAPDAFFHLATDHICGRTWFSNPVSFNLEYACLVQTLRWEFLSPRLLPRNVVSHLTKPLSCC